MTARATSGLAYDDYLYLTGESPNIDEKVQASVILDYVNSRIRTDTNSGLEKVVTGNYTSENPFYDLKLDVDNLAAVGGTASVTDYITIDQGAGTKKLQVGDLPFASSASTVTSVIEGPGIEVSPTTGIPKVSAELTTDGGLEFSAVGDAGTLQIAQGISEHDVAQFTTGVVDDDFLRINGTTVEGRSAAEVLSDIGAQAALSFGISSGDVTKCGSGIVDNDFIRIDGTTTEGRSAAEVLTDIAASPVAGSSSIVTIGTVTSGTISTGAVIGDATMTLGSDAEGDIYYRDAAGKLKNLAADADGKVMTLASGIPSWTAAGHITAIEGEGTTTTGVLSTGVTGTTKFLRVDGDDSCSWVVPPDTDTTYSAGDGLDLTGTTFSTDLKTNGGIVIESGELAVDLGASSITGTLANADLTNSSVSYGGVSISLGGSDATPAFDLADATNYEGDAILSTGETGTTKFLRVDGDNSSSWQVPPDTNTTYTAGDGLDLTGTTFSTDLMTNGGLEITSTELSVAVGISQYDVAQFDTGVADDDFLRINGTAVEGRSASEVLSDIGAQAALSFGISSGDVTKCGAGIADNDFLRIDGTTTEGRSASEVLSDIAASPVAGSASIVTTGTLTAGFIQGETTGSTGVLSTGEGGGTKFLREDGDGTCSWQAVPAGVTAGFSIAMAVAL